MGQFSAVGPVAGICVCNGWATLIDASKTETRVKGGALMVEDARLKAASTKAFVIKQVEVNVDWATDEEIEFVIAKVDGSSIDKISSEIVNPLSDQK